MPDVLEIIHLTYFKGGDMNFVLVAMMTILSVLSSFSMATDAVMIPEKKIGIKITCQRYFPGYTFVKFESQKSFSVLERGNYTSDIKVTSVDIYGDILSIVGSKDNMEYAVYFDLYDSLFSAVDKRVHGAAEWQPVMICEQ